MRKLSRRETSCRISSQQQRFVFVFFALKFVFCFVFVFAKALPIADCQGGRLLARFPVASRGRAESEQRRSLEGLSVSNKRLLLPLPPILPNKLSKREQMLLCNSTKLSQQQKSNYKNAQFLLLCPCLLHKTSGSLLFFFLFLFEFFVFPENFLKIIRFTKKREKIFGKHVICDLHGPHGLANDKVKRPECPQSFSYKYFY